MISCQQTCQLLGEYMDGELASDDATAVSDHLDQCEICAIELRALCGINDQLTDVFSTSDLSTNIQNLKSSLDDHEFSEPPRSKIMIPVWCYTAIAASLIAALTISIGYVLSGPSSEQAMTSIGESQQSQSTVVAQLVRATGEIEVLVPGGKQWSHVTPDDQSRICEGARIRTGESVLCELNTAGNSKIRMDETAEVVLHNESEIQVVRGQIWCLAAQDTEMKIEIGVGEIKSDSIASFRCPETMEVQCRADAGAATCDSVAWSNPPAKMIFADMRCSIQAGESVSVDSTRSMQRESAVAEAAKIWQLPLLAVGKSVDGELPQTLTKLLAPIGMTKARHLHELQIRALGPRGAIPLLAFAMSEESLQEQKTRRTAVSIGCDLADESAIKWLRQLKSDQDPFVARQAEVGLKRIAADTQ